MNNVFSGLDKLGFDVKDVDIYEAEKKVEKIKRNVVIKETAKVKIADILYDRKVMCPVCGEYFITRSVRAGKSKLLSVDTDLRPKYDLITPYAYDIILCNCCGYTALNRFFKKITPTQAEWVKNKISNNYRGRKYPDEYTYDMAIERYKLALLNAVVKRSKASEKAYICLKLSWLYRSYWEDLLKTESENNALIEACKKNELVFVEKAFEGFVSTYQGETFPVCGMEEVTVMYLVGELARRLGKNSEASRWISKVIISNDANKRLKERARQVKDLIKVGMKEEIKEQ